MRCRWFLLIALFGVLSLPVLGQPTAPYKLEMEAPRASTETKEDGRSLTRVTVKFTITQQGQQVEDISSDYKILIEEDGQVVHTVDIPRPQVSEDLSVVLAVDTSGSMKQHGRMEQARAAAGVFFRELPAKAEAGLILFDDKLRLIQPLGKDRGRLTSQIEKVQPEGGTAYLDACKKAVELLQGIAGKEKAIVVMTDGVDLNSTATLEQVIHSANDARVRIYPIGIGRPGGQQKVTSVLVLDRSGSMLLPANDSEKVSKLEAMKVAARRFADTIRYTPDGQVRTTIIEFSDGVSPPREFTSNKYDLFNAIKQIGAQGETAVFDATYDAICTLEAEHPSGKTAVIALTDGIDNASRRRVDEVIARAREAKVRLFMLGFGKPGELDADVMRRMAKETDGAYFHAEDQKSLIKVFEDLSIQLHDDGIDEATLTKLAADTGGKYYPAQDVDKLQLILKTVTQGIQRKEYEITFPSRYQWGGGVAHDVQLKLARLNSSSGSLEVVGTKTGFYQRRGLVLAQLSPAVYLGMLIGLGLLLVLPVGLGKLMKSTTKT